MCIRDSYEGDTFFQYSLLFPDGRLLLHILLLHLPPVLHPLVRCDSLMKPSSFIGRLYFLLLWDLLSQRLSNFLHNMCFKQAFVLPSTLFCSFHVKHVVCYRAKRHQHCQQKRNKINLKKYNDNNNNNKTVSYTHLDVYKRQD